MNEVLTALHYVDKILLVLSDARSGVSICLFAIVIFAHVGIASASITLVFLVSDVILKNILKTMETNKTNKNKNFFIS